MPNENDSKVSLFELEHQWRKDVVKYVKEFKVHWKGAVVSTAISYFLSVGAKYGFNLPVWSASLTTVCGGLTLTSFSIWRSERRKLDKLEERFVPKLIVSCPTDPESEPKKSKWTHKEARFLRLLVSTPCMDEITGCCGYLTAISAGGVRLWGDDDIMLTFAPGERSDSQSRSIFNDLPAWLDVIAITDDNEVVIANKLRNWVHSTPLNEIFKQDADYHFHIVIKGYLKGQIVSVKCVAKVSTVYFWPAAKIEIYEPPSNAR